MKDIEYAVEADFIDIYIISPVLITIHKDVRELLYLSSFVKIELQLFKAFLNNY